MKRAVVLGGGVAGITAAFRLLDRDYEVELIDQRRWLGGRAFSMEDERMGGLRDNGPHVMLGCYDAMRWMLRRIGSEDDFLQCRTLQLAYVERGGRRYQLRLSRLPTPLAMPLALVGLRGMGVGGKLRTLRGFLSALRRAPRGWSLEEWLVDRMQQGAPRQLLWDPMCRAIMNAEAHQVSAEQFLGCLREAFTGWASRAAFWFPKRPWLQVIGEPAVRQLAAEGAQVTLGTKVAGLARDANSGKVTAVQLGDDSGRELGAEDIVVSAMPWHALAGLLPDDLQQPGMQLEGSPNLAVYFDAGEQNPLPDQEPLTYMVDGHPFHYVYRTPGDRPGRFALIADGCVTLKDRTADEIERLGREQLNAYYGQISLPEETLVRVSKEPQATFVATPQVETARLCPGPLPGAPNLLICGEWTDSGLPSTMEGAARSARLAVR
ncbi:MAG: FAD-dependent oxidoreductase [Planctomycetota bacterium]